jgi:hypothetical protein
VYSIALKGSYSVFLSASATMEASPFDGFATERIAAMPLYTLAHVIISLAGIGTGLVVVAGFLTNRRLDGWNTAFLLTTVATSVTGFGFPVERVLPSHIVGVVSMLVLAVIIFVRYARRSSPGWRRVYVAGSVTALYLNVFVLIVQAFLRVPALNASAPTQSEPPFQIAQLVALLLFVTIGIRAVRRFRDGAGTIDGDVAHKPRRSASV